MSQVVGQMQNTVHDLGGWKFAASWILLTPPLFGALCATVVSWFVARRNVYINSITVERSKWLEKIRANVAEHSGLLTASHSVHVIADMDGANVDQLADKLASYVMGLSRCQSMLLLQLNPEGVVDKHIIAILNEMTVITGESMEVTSWLNDLMILHFQFLLKEEWEKVKYEAGGVAARLSHRLKRKARAKKYADFLARKGRYDELVAKLRGIRANSDPNKVVLVMNEQAPGRSETASASSEDSDHGAANSSNPGAEG